MIWADSNRKSNKDFLNVSTECITDMDKVSVLEYCKISEKMIFQ